MKKALPLLLFFFVLNLEWAIGQETQLTVLSYNIYHGEHYHDLGKSNLQEIAQLINRHQPDFVALQEVDSMTNRSAALNGQIPMDLVQELAEMTGMYGYFAKAIDFDNGGYGEGLLSRFPAKMSHIQLPTPKGGEGRAIALATVTLSGGEKVTFGGTHLCHEFDENRAAQIKALLDTLDQNMHPTILAGDFNFGPENISHPLLEKHYLDAAATYGAPQPTIPSDDPQTRIDYIWLSRSHQWKITKVEVIPTMLSDHLPLLVKATLVH